MNILLKFCTLQIQFNLNKINHRNWNVWEIYSSLSAVGKNRELLKSSKNSQNIFILALHFFFVLNAEFGQIFGINEEERVFAKSQGGGDKFGSLKILTVFRLALHQVNWKPVYFTNFWGIKSRIYDACEISNCRDKKHIPWIFGYESLDIGFLSFLLQKCISCDDDASSKKQNGECNTMGKL